MSSILTLVGIGCIAAGVKSCLRHIEKIGKRKILNSRTLLSDTEICNQFYSSTTLPREMIVLAWRRVGQALGVEYGKLRPEDKLENLLGLPNWIGSDGDTGIDILGREIEDVATAEQLLTIDQIQNVGDVVDFFINANARH